MRKMITISVEIPKETEQIIRDEARERMISKSAVVREVLVHYVRNKPAKQRQEHALVHG
jgi:hypothetical protein